MAHHDGYFAASDTRAPIEKVPIDCFRYGDLQGHEIAGESMQVTHGSLAS
jgi:hypothetical protein